MMIFLCIVATVSIVGLLCLFVHLVDESRPRCPRCNHKMRYKGMDESDREIWVCDVCEERIVI